MLDTYPVPTQVFRIHWLDHLDDQTIDEVHRVVSAVVELGAPSAGFSHRLAPSSANG
jgi:hypothetical protein